MKEPSPYLTKHQVDLLYELVDLGYSFQNSRCFVLEIEDELSQNEKIAWFSMEHREATSILHAAQQRILEFDPVAAQLLNALRNELIDLQELRPAEWNANKTIWLHNRRFDPTA